MCGDAVKNAEIFGCSNRTGWMNCKYLSGSFKEYRDGRLLFQADYTDKENLIEWLLSFGEKAELIEPEKLRAEIINRIEEMKKKYND